MKLAKKRIEVNPPAAHAPSPLHAAYCADDACQTRVRVLENVQLARDTYRVRLDCPEVAARIVPGQFVMLRIADVDDPLLGRPLALYDTALSLDVQLCVAIKKIFTPFGFGRITHRDGYVTSIEEKPTFETEILAGIYVFSPKLFEIIPENEYFGVDTLIKTMLARSLRIGKYDLTEYWIDIGQVPDYEKAQKDYQLYFGSSEE